MEKMRKHRPRLEWFTVNEFAIFWPVFPPGFKFEVQRLIGRIPEQVSGIPDSPWGGCSVSP